MEMEQNFTSLIDEMYDTIVDEEIKELGINIADENYKVLDINQANFFLRRINDLNREIAQINEMCDNEINNFERKVNEFRNTKISSLENTVNYFSTLLEKFAQSELADSKKKSLKLPFGTLQFKKSADKYEYEDEKLLQFINENQLTGLTRTKIELNKADIKKALVIEDNRILLDGKEIDSVKITPGETKFSVKLA